ncbi:MAG: LysR family transcriptional regulator [Clostridia bacterium]|nr:LysR family transcriptional regulator [Clostridia bacterium]
MDLDDMKMILAIARSGSMTAAARALYVSQPALSKRLNRFEQEVRARLFERIQGSRRMTLTPAGKMLIPFAEKWDSLRQDIGMLHDLSSRTHFFVDTVDTAAETLLPDAVRRFCRDSPDTEMVVRRHSDRDCYASLHDGTGDVAFVTQEHYYQNLAASPLLREEMLLIVPISSPFDGTADTGDLEWEKEIVIPWNNEFLRWRQDRLRFTRHPNVSLCSMSMALPFLNGGEHWMIAPRTEADRAVSLCPSLKCLPLNEPPPDRTVWWVEEISRHHPATDRLLDILRRQMKDREGVRLL